MDKTFNPASTQPPEGKIVELWSGGIVRGYKRDGVWFTENGTRVMAAGWRSVDKPPKPKRERFEPAWSDDEIVGSPHKRANKLPKKAKKKK